MDGETRYTIDDLTALTGFSRRTIRFYVEKGLVEAPAGRGKGGFYGESQLSSLRRIAEAKLEGRSLAFLARESIPGAGMPPGAGMVHEDAFPYRSKAPEKLAGPVSMLRWELAPGLYLDATGEAAALHGGLLAALLKTAGLEEYIGEGLARRPAQGGNHARTGDE
jgi:hypothetical protein